MHNLNLCKNIISGLNIGDFSKKIGNRQNLLLTNISSYCILRGQIKGFNRSITTILFEVGSYRTVVGTLE